jgi:phosphotriesterase-related protein
VAEAAEQGAWISFDGLTEESGPHILKLVKQMRQRGHLDQVLLSHDGDSYCNGEFRPYHLLFTDFVSTLKDNGFSTTDLERLTVENPRRALTSQIRGTG